MLLRGEEQQLRLYWTKTSFEKCVPNGRCQESEAYRGKGRNIFQILHLSVPASAMLYRER